MGRVEIEFSEERSSIHFVHMASGSSMTENFPSAVLYLSTPSSRHTVKGRRYLPTLKESI